MLALSQRCPPCTAFWDQLEVLASTLAERDTLLVLAVPDDDGSGENGMRLPRLTGHAALAARGLASFPSLALVDAHGRLRARGVLRTVEEVPEIADLLRQTPVNAGERR